MHRTRWQHDSLDAASTSAGPAEEIVRHDEDGRLRPDAAGNLIGSLADEDIFGPTHMPVIDIDHPVQLVPSSTPGHYHLYIDVAVDQGAYFDMLDAMARAGVVEHGFARAARVRGMSMVRHSDVKKQGS